MNISLLIPKGKSKKKQIESELVVAKNIKSKKIRESIIEGLSKILQNYEDGKAFYWINNELQIFNYKGIDSFYECGKEIIVPEINNKIYGFVVMDLKECSLYELRGKKKVLLWHATSNVPKKQGSGGQSAKRFERNRQIAINLWFKDIADKMKENWLYKIKN